MEVSGCVPDVCMCAVCGGMDLVCNSVCLSVNVLVCVHEYYVSVLMWESLPV